MGVRRLSSILARSQPAAEYAGHAVIDYLTNRKRILFGGGLNEISLRLPPQLIR
jgi:hypothetical protein